MEVSKKRLAGGKLIFLNLGYLAIGMIIFLAINPFNWWEVTEPKEIAKEFLEAVERGDWEKAKKYGTDESDNALDLLESLSEPGYRAVTILEETRENDKVYVSYTLDYSAETLMLTLVKERGNWRVETTKEELNKRGEDQEDTDWETEIEETMEELEWEEPIEDSEY